VIDDRPAPLVPAEVDHRDYPNMPLDVRRLRDSDLATVATAEEFKAAVLLWCAAWHQVPAGSLPNDDRLLARYSDTGRRWPKVRAQAMRGFVLCADDRWHHPVLAAKVLEAWQSKLARRHQTRAATAARSARTPKHSGPTDGQRDEHRHVQRNGHRDDPHSHERNVHQENRKEIESSLREPRARGEQAPKAGNGAGTVTPGEACRAMRAAGVASVNPADPRLLALLEQGVALDELTAVASEASNKGKGFAWILAAVEGRRADAARIHLEQREDADPRCELPSSVDAKARALGLPVWDAYQARLMAQGEVPVFQVFRRQVLEADAAAHARTPS
jgi:hypothetical protein